jgi:hypothetical protein
VTSRLERQQSDYRIPAIQERRRSVARDRVRI